MTWSVTVKMCGTGCALVSSGPFLLTSGTTWLVGKLTGGLGGTFYLVFCTLTFSSTPYPPPVPPFLQKSTQILLLWLAGCQATRTVREAVVTLG